MVTERLKLMRWGAVVPSIGFFVLILFFLSCGKTQDDKFPESIDLTVTLSDSITFNGSEIYITCVSNKEVREVKFYVNDSFIGSRLSLPYIQKYTLKDFAPQIHNIKCIAESINGNQYVGQSQFRVILRIGDEYKGGKIFLLNDSQNSGLIAAMTDLYYNGTDRFYWADNVLIGRNTDDGKLNTTRMTENSSNIEQIGFILRSGFTYNGYNDWYLPAINELKILKEKKNIVGGFATETNWLGLYWSSSELTATTAEALNFNSLMGNSYGKNSSILKVRLIRKF